LKETNKGIFFYAMKTMIRFMEFIDIINFILTEHEKA